LVSRAAQSDSKLALSVSGSVNMLWAATLAVGFFMAPIWATGFNLAEQSIKLTATISNIIILGDSFGAVVLPWVTGQAIEHLSAQTIPRLVFASLAMNALVFVMILRQRKLMGNGDCGVTAG
jgi:fucose permease